MKICIEKTEDGQFMVGQMAQGPDIQADDEGHYDMEPVESLDMAFERARTLLSDDPTGEVSAEGDEQFAKGFKTGGGEEFARGGM